MSDSRRFVGQIDPRIRGHKTHICAACDFPIAVYGRCAPCLHAYCLTCASTMAQCIICKSFITKLERLPAEAGIFISPLTLQGYRTEADLAKHAQQMEQQLQQFAAVADAGTSGGGGMLGVAAAQPPPPAHPPPAHLMPAGWKPPPPAMPPGPGTAAAAMTRQQQAAGMRPPASQHQHQQQQQQQQQRPRQGVGAVMRPR